MIFPFHSLAHFGRDPRKPYRLESEPWPKIARVMLTTSKVIVLR